MFKLLSIFAALAFVVMGVVVGLLNPVSVDLNLFFLTVTLPLSVVMAALLVVGMAVGGMIVYIQVLKLRWRLRCKTRENQKLSDDILQLKKQQVQVKELQAHRDKAENDLDSANNVMISIGKQ